MTYEALGSQGGCSSRPSSLKASSECCALAHAAGRAKVNNNDPNERERDREREEERKRMREQASHHQAACQTHSRPDDLVGRSLRHEHPEAEKLARATVPLSPTGSFQNFQPSWRMPLSAAVHQEPMVPMLIVRRSDLHFSPGR